jgi:hypothetical protein
MLWTSPAGETLNGLCPQANTLENSRCLSRISCQILKVKSGYRLLKLPLRLPWVA